MFIDENFEVCFKKKIVEKDKLTYPVLSLCKVNNILHIKKNESVTYCEKDINKYKPIPKIIREHLDEEGKPICNCKTRDFFLPCFLPSYKTLRFCYTCLVGLRKSEEGKIYKKQINDLLKYYKDKIYEF